MQDREVEYHLICPRCGASKKVQFEDVALQDDKTKSVEYHCRCGCQFVCYGDSFIQKNDWINKCNAKDYLYPYQ